jgi:hypothetical protein
MSSGEANIPAERDNWAGQDRLRGGLKKGLDRVGRMGYIYL